MKNLIITAATILLGVSYGISQQSYEIITIGNSYSEQDINQAFAGANFCNRIYKNTRRTILLNDGAEIELFSAEESGIDSGCGLNSNYVFRPEEWGIKNGKITIKQEATLQKK